MKIHHCLFLLIGCCVGGLFGTSLAADTDANRAPDVNIVGPCPSTGYVDLTETTVGKIMLSSGKVTLPGCENLDRVGLVLFHNGFSGRKEYYREYANTLASWGWAVLQYDLNCFNVPLGGPCPQLQDIKDEVDALPGVLAWARNQTAAANPAAAARIDWASIVVGGHSRGADVSAHTAARFPAQPAAAPAQQCDTAADTAEGSAEEGSPAGEAGAAGAGTCAADPTQLRVAAVLLVDPVAKDAAKTPPISSSQPYYAIVGKGSWACAPKRKGAKNFIPRPDPPLTQAVHIPSAGHAQFWQAPPRWQNLYDLTCGTGKDSDATVRAWTARLLSAWLLQNLAPEINDIAGGDAIEANKRWILEREQAGDFRQWLRS